MATTSLPKTVTQGVAFHLRKHECVSSPGDSPKKISHWKIESSEDKHAWAFSNKLIHPGEKVRLVAKADSVAFNENWNEKYPASALRQGYFTFTDKNPYNVSKEVLNGPVPIKCFDGVDKLETNLRVNFEKGGIYEFWASTEKPEMQFAKVRIEENGDVTVEEMFDPKIMRQLEGFSEYGFWLMMRTTPGMTLQFLDPSSHLRVQLKKGHTYELWAPRIAGRM